MKSRTFVLVAGAVLAAGAAASAALPDSSSVAAVAQARPTQNGQSAPAPPPAPDPAPTPPPAPQIWAPADLDDLVIDVQAAVDAAVDAEAIARQVEAAVDGEAIARHVQSALSAVDLAMPGRPRLGLGVRDLSSDEATKAGLPGIAGALVTDVADDSPAARAGLADGDIVVRIDGQDVRSARHLTRLVDETPAGRTVPIEYVRGGVRAQADVTLPASPTFRETFRRRVPDTFAYRMGEPLVRGRMRGRLGIGVQDLTAQLAAHFGVKGGVLVTEVTEGSPAARGGIKAGDVVTRVHDTTVTRVGDLTRALAAVEAGTAVDVEVTRDRVPQTLQVTLDTRPTRTPTVVRPRGRSAAD